MSSKISILVVDDEKAILLTFEKLLAKTFPDIVVYTAENGKEAWDIVSVHHPNIIISDINMPVMDGFQLLIKVRSNPEYNDIFFILLTGNTEVSERIKALDKGADEFITKPVVSVALEARIRAALRIVRLQQQMKEENQLLVELAEELEKDIHDMALLAVKFMQARIPTSQEMLSRVADSSVWIARQLGKFTDDEIRDIEARCQIVHGDRQNAGDKDIGNSPGFAPFLQGLEKCLEETVIPCQFAVQMISAGHDQLIGEIVILVDDDIQTRQVGIGYDSENTLQVVSCLIFMVYRNFTLKPSGIAADNASEFAVADKIEALFNIRNISARINRGKIKMQHEKRISQRSRIFSYPCISEQSPEIILLPDVVVAFQNPAPQRFAESARAEKYRIVHRFQFADIGRFINKIAVFMDDFLIIGIGV